MSEPVGLPGEEREGLSESAGREDGGWAAAIPEFCIGGAVIVVAVVTGWALGGLPGAAVAMASSAVAALAVMRTVAAPPGLADPEHPYLLRGADAEENPASFAGYWRSRAGLGIGVSSMAAYDSELRGTLQQLLAARLAEHHGISLQHDPLAARRLLCPRRADQDLWYWIDPARPPAGALQYSPAQQRAAQYLPGIPPRTLARLVDRLERL